MAQVTTLLLSNTLLQNSGSPSVIVGSIHVSPHVYSSVPFLVSLKFLKMLNPFSLVQYTFSSIIDKRITGIGNASRAPINTKSEACCGRAFTAKQESVCNPQNPLHLTLSKVACRP